MVFSGLNNKEFFDLEIFVDGQDGSLVINDNVSLRILDFICITQFAGIKLTLFISFS